MPNTTQPPIIFFDGFCILCNGFVDFVLKRDKLAHFRFASLQGQTAASVLKAECIDGLRSIVLLDESGCYQRSDAVLRILLVLGGVYRLLWLCKLIPRPLRDFVYDFVAKHRYRWFGKRAACRVPLPEEKGRILD